MKRILFLLTIVAVGCGGPNDSNDVSKLLETAWQSFEQGDYRKAEFGFNEVLSRDAQNVEAQAGTGWARAFQRNYDTAIEAWQLGLDVDSTAVDIWAGLCTVYQVTGDFPACIAAGNKVLSLSPNYVFAHKSDIDVNTIRGIMASAHFGLEQFEEAAALMDAADPANAPHSTDPKRLLEAIMNFLGFK